MPETSSLSGVIAPVLTPMRGDLSPDPERLAAHCRRLLGDGCHGLVLFGTTGEANSLSVDERIALLEAVAADGLDPATLIVGTGMCAVPDAVRLSRHAVEQRCAAVLMLPPFYYKGVSDDGLFAAFAETIERVGDERLRVYLYHIPGVSGVAITLGLIERLLTSYEACVVGVKDSSGDWGNTLAMLERFPGFAVFPGNELNMLEALRRGCPGCISATANVNAAAIRRLYDGWQTPEAEALQARLTAVRRAVETKPMIPALKRILGRILARGDGGWLNLRPPLVGLGDDEAKDLFAALDDAGFAASAP